ncbi:hypothetical protein DFJ73DRAFT_921864 [Zopfochytrium polystomum]|nr:hypothetical protein DFJ73DRAFT_921864 [Zopfochytrium polystomum]
MAMAMAPADEESAAVAAKARASTSTTTTTTTSTTTTTTTATTATATLPSAIPAVLTLCAYLNPPDRLRLATLFRLRSIQIAAVVAHRAPRELDHASALGDVDLLAHLDAHAARTATRLRGTHAAVDTASARGHLAVLRWWRARGGVVLYSAAAVDAASANGHLRVLRWWRDEAGLEIRYSEKAFDAACRNADFPVLAWWAGCGLPIRCSHDLVDRLATDGRIEVLRWLVAAGVKLVGLSSNAPVDGHPRSPGVLSACTLRVTADGLRGATRNGHLAVLQWLHADVLRRDFPRSVRGVMDLASAADTNFNVALLDFWLRRLAPLGLDYTMAAIDGASARGDLAALRWWKRSGLVLKYSSAAVNAASAAGRIDVLRWWRRSALKLEYTTACRRRRERERARGGPAVVEEERAVFVVYGCGGARRDRGGDTWEC